MLEQRLCIRDLLQAAPGLRHFLAEAAAGGGAYGDGAKPASKWTGLALARFPDALPYELEALLDDDWLPEGD